MKSVTTYPLRLPHSLKAAVARIAKEDGTSINQFVVTAVAEKLAALETASFFVTSCSWPGDQSPGSRSQAWSTRL